MVGGGEGGGGATGGLTGWLIEMQSYFTRIVAGDLKALHGDPTALWGLIGFGFAYGVFHAAGPGHGKAVIASYMMASDRALKRGIVLAFLAAALQGAVAIALVGVAAAIFNATATQMNARRRLAGAGELQRRHRDRPVADADQRPRAAGGAQGAFRPSRRRSPPRRFTPARPGGRRRGRPPQSRFAPRRPEALRTRSWTTPACGHLHAPDPRTLEAGFSWRGAAATVAAAGSRPCSGAILVLVFALSQGLFAAGIAAVAAMSFGVALTTGALAFAAVFAKRVAMRLAAGDDSRVLLAARGFEFAAALLVVAFGVALLLASNA